MEEIIKNLAMWAPGFLLAIVCHEVAHGYAATRFGDETPRFSGRLTMNPTSHIDPIGTILFPILGIVLGGGVMFGWGKPIPINERNFKNVRSGVFWTSFAGPMTNILLGIISSFFLALLSTGILPDFSLASPLRQILQASMITNLYLAGFNLIPLPPLDGSRMITSVLSYNALKKYEVIAQYSFFILIIMMFTGIFSKLLAPFFYFAEWITNLFIYLLGSI